MQRNTFMFVSVLAVVAALVVGVNIGKSMASPTKIPETKTLTETPAITPTPITTLVTYSNDRCGITLTHPSNLQLLESTASGTILTDPKKQEDSIIIICQKDIPRVPLANDKMEKLTIGSASGSATLSATLYHDSSKKDGTRIDKLIFFNKFKNVDVFIAGFGTVYNKVIASLKLN